MDMRERDWASAMAAGREGDEATYARLLSDVALRLRPAVRAGLRRRGLVDADAEDVVQEVLMAIHAKRFAWDADRPLLPWLNAIARHKLADAARRLSREARRRREIPDGDWEDLFEAPMGDPDVGAIDVERHVQSLSGRQRAVVGALVFEGVSVKEVAGRLGSSEGSVRMTFHRALTALREALGAKEVAPPTGNLKAPLCAGEPT